MYLHSFAGVRSRRQNLPAELLFFTGDCADLTTQQEIAVRLIKIIEDSSFGDICKNSAQECSVNNVDVTCGPQSRGDLGPSRLHKRSIAEPSQALKNITRLFFEIGTPGGDALAESNEALVDSLKEILLAQLSEILAGIDRLSPRSNHGAIGDMSGHSSTPSDGEIMFGDVVLECDEGFVAQEGSTSLCSKYSLG